MKYNYKVRIMSDEDQWMEIEVECAEVAQQITILACAARQSPQTRYLWRAENSQGCFALLQEEVIVAGAKMVEEATEQCFFLQ